MLPNRSYALVILALVSSVALANRPDSVAAQSGAPAFEWRGTVLQGNAIEIKGVNGDLTAEPAPGGEVEVSAVRTGRRSDPNSVRLEVVQHGDGVTICAVYPDSGSRPNECRPGDEGRMNVKDNDVNVAFTVRVPAGVRFVGRTVNGDVTTGALSAPVTISTVNGTAEFSTSAHGEASTVNGSIKGTLGSALWTGELSFSTVNGSITLDLPADISADVRATTVNGDITTDFPLTVSGRISRRSLNGTIGAGGRSMELETVNGSVKLNRR
jgi:hypothetical protein